MGLIKSALNSASTVLGDQWREFFYCDSLSQDILAVKGKKRVAKGSSNTKGADNIISNGSVIAVNEGQAMMIVDQGAIVEFTAEAGEYTWDSSTEGTIFYGGFGKGLKSSWDNFKRRFTFGGDTGKDQRVYFFNTKEITGNKYGTPNPVPFRVVDKNIGLDVDISIRCNGVYSYKLTDPILFYKNVCGNVADDYKRSEIDQQLKSEFLTALQPAFGKISEMGVRYSALPNHTIEMADALNEVLSAKWSAKRGISVGEVTVNSATASKEDEDMIKELQKTAVYRNPNMGAAALVGAQAEAMKKAANNPNGAMMGFMGMNMANQSGGMNAQALYEMGQSANNQQNNQDSVNTVVKSADNSSDGWTCTCGNVNTGKFCTECGNPQPAQEGWTCACGALNKGKFCSECGAKKPADAPLYKCDKCGWEPEDPHNPPKFCPECGDPFNDSDIIN